MQQPRSQHLFRNSYRLGFGIGALLLVCLFGAMQVAPVLAQDAPAADTPTAQPPLKTSTAQPTEPPLETETPQPTEPPATSTMEPTATAQTPVPTDTQQAPATEEPPPPSPVTIPEPITAILFGSGLAALSAAAAARRRRQE